MKPPVAMADHTSKDARAILQTDLDIDSMQRFREEANPMKKDRTFCEPVTSEEFNKQAKEFTMQELRKLFAYLREHPQDVYKSQFLTELEKEARAEYKYQQRCQWFARVGVLSLFWLPCFLLISLGNGLNFYSQLVATAIIIIGMAFDVSLLNSADHALLVHNVIVFCTGALTLIFFPPMLLGEHTVLSLQFIVPAAVGIAGGISIAFNERRLQKQQQDKNKKKHKQNNNRHQQQQQQGQSAAFATAAHLGYAMPFAAGALLGGLYQVQYTTTTTTTDPASFMGNLTRLVLAFGSIATIAAFVELVFHKWISSSAQSKRVFDLKLRYAAAAAIAVNAVLVFAMMVVA